jgi:hypothetical protein
MEISRARVIIGRERMIFMLGVAKNQSCVSDCQSVASDFQAFTYGNHSRVGDCQPRVGDSWP